MNIAARQQYIIGLEASMKIEEAVIAILLYRSRIKTVERGWASGCRGVATKFPSP
jgi:hypothetical protein